MQPFLIPPDSPPDMFPDPELALDEPNGLLAVGGDLDLPRLMCAYRRGIFPWFSDGQPVLWWCPDPRAVLWPRALRISRRLRRKMRGETFTVSVDTAFERVVQGCAAPRARGDRTWITREMKGAYVGLHHAGHAHSVECWHGADLAGGVYGVAIGRVFFGESMFSRVADASKVALAHLCSLGFALVDCQLPNPHLSRLGAVEIGRGRFLALLDELCGESAPRIDPSPSPRAGAAS